MSMVAQRQLEDGRVLTVYPELFDTACLLIDDNPHVRGETTRDRWRQTDLGEEPQIRESDGGADLYYQYPSYEHALAAWSAFTVDDVEPMDGWLRSAPPRFRRRPDGDSAREFVAP